MAGRLEQLDGKIGEPATGYERWLERQPLSANAKKTYRTRVRGFLEYLAVTPIEYGDPLADEHARDYDPPKMLLQNPQ